MVTAAFTKLGISVAGVIYSKVTTRCVQCTLDLWHSSLPVLWSDISQTESKCLIESPSTFKLQLHIWWSSDVVFSTRFFSSKTRQTFSFICILSDKYAAFVVIEFHLSKGLFFAVTILLKYFVQIKHGRTFGKAVNRLCSLIYHPIFILYQLSSPTSIHHQYRTNSWLPFDHMFHA